VDPALTAEVADSAALIHSDCTVLMSARTTTTTTTASRGLVVVRAG